MGGEVAFEAADGFAHAFPFACAAGDVGDRFWVVFAPADGDGVEGAVELAVSARVEAVADGLAGGGGDGGCGGEAGEGGFAVDAAVV